MSEPTHYVAGFLFDEERKRVVLVVKNRPAWQAGKLNGVGGHIEPGEWARDAMRREFLEETGLDVPEWHHFADIGGAWGAVWFFRAVGDVDAVRTVEDEEIVVLPVADALALPHIPNLSWLIPLAAYTHDTYAPVSFMEVANPA